MRDPPRIKKILRLIENKWSCEPDQRLLQLLMNVLISSNKTILNEFKEGPNMKYIPDPYYIEDDDLLEALEAW